VDFESENEDEVGYLGEEKEVDEEKNDDDFNEDFELEVERDLENEQIENVGEDPEQESAGEEWDEIDWSGDVQNEGGNSIWDEIDWSDDGQGQRENSIWDEIDWNDDVQNEREKDEIDKNSNENGESNKEDLIENVGSETTTIVITDDSEEDVEDQDQEEEIEIPLEEIPDNPDPIVNTEEIEFINKIEELAEFARETKGEDEVLEPQVGENSAYHAEKYYENLKENEVVSEQYSKEDQEIEESRQEVTEESKNLEEINETSKEITSTEEFEYLWNIREELDREEKSSEEIEEIMHEAEEIYNTLKEAENIIEEQQLEKLKQVNHEDEASVEDLREDLDRVDLIEQAVELEQILVQQERSQEEIDMKVEEAIEETIETSEFGETLEKLYEEQEIKKSKLADLEDEESVGILKEDLDRVDLIEQAVELEEILVQQGKSQEEIDVRVEEAIERTELEENLENLLEEQLHRQVKSQEEIDEQMEAAASNYQKEINNKQENEVGSNVNEKIEEANLEIKEQNSIAEELDQIEQTSTLHKEKKAETCENVENKEKMEVLKRELETIESESEEKKELLEDGSKLASEETEEEEDEHLQELYHQQTDKRPIYAKKRTKGYIQWLEQRELESEKIKNSQSESEIKKEIEEEGWKTTLKRWIKEASEDECNIELKSELEKALEKYKEFENLTKKLMKLYEKSKHEKLSEEEKNAIKSLIEKLHQFDAIQLELLVNIRAIKKYINKHRFELMNRFHENRVHSRFFEQISQNYKELRKEQKKKINIKKSQREIDEMYNFFLGADILENHLLRFIEFHQELLYKEGKYLTRSYLGEICSKIAINIGLLPKSFYNVMDLIQNNKTTFNKTLNKWAKKHGFATFRDYTIKHKLSPFKVISEQICYLHKPIKIDFNSLIQPYIDNMVKWVKEKDHQEISNKRFGGSFPIKQLITIYKKRGLHGWSGIVYKITQIKDINGDPISNGLIQIGLTTERFSQRWYWYNTDAFIELSNLRIHTLMRYLETKGENLRKVHPLNAQGIGYLGANKSFTYEILEVCWSDNKLRTKEKYWIKHFKKLYPKRIGNISKGGGGGSLIPIPRSALIPLIALGLWSPDISKIFAKKYNRVISKDVITKRINEYWGSLRNARKLYLKPVLETLMSHGYSATYLSENLFSTVNSHTISKWSSEIFWNIDFKDKRKMLIKERLKSLIIQGLDSYEMDKKFDGVPWETIRKEYIPEWWRNLRTARILITKPILSKMLAQKKDISQIAKELNHDSLERTRYLIALCWNFKSEKYKWNVIKNFINYIGYKNPSREQLMKLKYDDIKGVLNKIDYLKFLDYYQMHPEMTLKEFYSHFPDISKSNYYYWKKKAEDSI